MERIGKVQFGGQSKRDRVERECRKNVEASQQKKSLLNLVSLSLDDSKLQ